MLAEGSTFTTATSAPDDTEWLIRVDQKGGSQCLSVRADGTVGTRKCSPSDASQRLRYYQAGSDRQGRPAYVIGFGRDGLGLSPNERFLARDPADGDRLRLVDGPRAEKTTAWSFVDQGPSTLDR